MGTLKMFSLGNFQTSNIVLTLVTMVYNLLSGHLFHNLRFVGFARFTHVAHLHLCNPYSILRMYELLCLPFFRTPSLALIAAVP